MWPGVTTVGPAFEIAAPSGASFFTGGKGPCTVGANTGAPEGEIYAPARSLTDEQICLLVCL